MYMSTAAKWRWRIAVISPIAASVFAAVKIETIPDDQKGTAVILSIVLSFFLLIQYGKAKDEVYLASIRGPKLSAEEESRLALKRQVQDEQLRQLKHELSRAEYNPGRSSHDEDEVVNKQHAPTMEPVVSQEASNFRITDIKHDPNAFDKVLGMDKAKEELKDALELPMMHPEKVEKYIGKMPSGLVLEGPPGTGKTHLARCAAEYFNASFYLVGASSITGSLVGSTEATIKGIFEDAKANVPAIIFFDEIDAIGAKRDGQNMNRPSDMALNTLLTELDGFRSRTGVFVLAATNRVDILDDALLRPGRFETKIHIPKPDLEGRVALLKFFAKNKPFAPGIEWGKIARDIEGWTGAYIQALISSAGKVALKRAIKNDQDDAISIDDLQYAIKNSGLVVEEERKKLSVIKEGQHE